MAKPPHQSPRKPRAPKHTIVVNGQVLQVTPEERLQWMGCAAALTGDLAQLRTYFSMRESDQLRDQLATPATPSTTIICAAPASETVGEALSFLRCGIWDRQYQEHYVIKINATGLDLALKSPTLEQAFDEKELGDSLLDAGDLQPFLQRRDREILERKLMKDKARLQADERVGYGSPPRAQRFKPGQSGWPKGRPKKADRLNVVGEQRMPSLRKRKHQEITVNDKVLKHLERLAMTNVKFLRLWIAVKEREKDWKEAQIRRNLRRIIIMKEYDDIGRALCDLGIAPKNEDGAVRGGKSWVRLCSWFVKEVLKRSPDILVGKGEATVLTRSMAEPKDLERCLAASGRTFPQGWVS